MHVYRKLHLHWHNINLGISNAMYVILWHVRGKLSFCWSSLSLHPQMMLLMRGKVSRRPGGHCDSIRWYQALAALTPEPPGPTATNSHNFLFLLEDYWPRVTSTYVGCIINFTIMCQRGDALYCKLHGTILFANQTYTCQRGDMYDKLLGRRPLHC